MNSDLTKNINKEISIIYVDDNPDGYLEEYLDKTENFGNKENIKYDSVIFDSSNDNYLTLIENDKIKKSNILIIDSRLFENANVEENSKFTGEEFKVIFSTVNPYAAVIVISQNDNLEKYGTIEKYKSSKDAYDDKSPEEASKEHYDNQLKQLITDNIKEIYFRRQILSYLKSDNSKAFAGSTIVDKIDGLMSGVTDYNELTDKKINELISLIENEIKPNLNTGREE